MMAEEITARIVEAIEEGSYGFISAISQIPILSPIRGF
jgi:hypothetical protein